MKNPMSKFSKLFSVGLIATALAGCGSSDNFVATNPGGSNPTSSFVVTEPATLRAEEDVIDTIELQAFDAHGNLLEFDQVLAQAEPGAPDHERTRVLRPFSNEMHFPALPANTDTVEVDYLRNGGYTLFRANEKVSPGQTRLHDPSEQPVNASSSKWELSKDSAGAFSLTLTKSVAGKVTSEPDFKIKGVCYSPTPINVRGDGLPNVGDFFFDNVTNSNGGVDFYNWFGLWGDKPMGDGFVARNDLAKIRGLKANTVRVYSMLSRQQGNDPNVFPEPTAEYHHRHKAFLDACWNGGVNPLYVIVGIPLPPDNVYYNLRDTTPAKVRFYDHVLRETIADLKDHPAVLGFTTQNELNDGLDAYPGTGGQMPADRPDLGTTTERSDYYWGKIKEHSDYAKTTAPDKLNGAAFHNFREIAQYASNHPQSGGTYLERATNLDFVGINVYDTVDYKAQYDNGWGAVQGDGRKALIFTELGFPATTRDNPDVPTGIREDVSTWQKTADLVKLMLPQAYQNGVSLGACYFEFSDEWWKQGGDEYPGGVRAVDRWAGGPVASGFPNGYWDEEGFGLFSIARYPGLKNSDPVLNEANNGPDRRVDRLTERTPITKVVRDTFNSL